MMNNTFLLIVAVFGVSSCGRAASVPEILRTVNDRLAREFVSHDGLLLDYVGDIPTPEEIVDLKPNAMLIQAKSKRRDWI